MRSQCITRRIQRAHPTVMALGSALHSEAVDLIPQIASAFATPHGGERFEAHGNELHQRQGFDRGGGLDLVRTALGFHPVPRVDMGIAGSAIIPNPIVVRASTASAYGPLNPMPSSREIATASCAGFGASARRP